MTLKFAEIYFSSAGMRVFDVLIEGTKVVSNLDVFAQVGQNTAYDVTVSVRVTDGTLNITFRSLSIMPRSAPSLSRHHEAAQICTWPSS